MKLMNEKWINKILSFASDIFLKYHIHMNFEDWYQNSTMNCKSTTQGLFISLYYGSRNIVTIARYK